MRKVILKGTIRFTSCYNFSKFYCYCSQKKKSIKLEIKRLASRASLIPVIFLLFYFYSEMGSIYSFDR